MSITSSTSAKLWPVITIAAGVAAADQAEFDIFLKRIKNSLPRDLADSLYGSNILTACGKELFNIELAIRKLQEWSFAKSTNTDGLSIWERLLGLAPAPTGVTFIERQNRVITKLKTRFSFFGKDFRNGVELLAGGPISTTIVNNVSGTVTITFTLILSIYSVNQIEAFCLESGPAHIQWIITSAGASNAFVAGLGKAGDIV